MEIIYCFWAVFLLGGGYYLNKTIHYYITPLNAEVVEETANFTNSIKSMLRSRFLLGLLGLITLIMTLFFLMDYQFNTIARLAYNDEGQLAGFLAVFLAVSNLVAVVIEFGFLSRIMSLLGVGNVLLLVTGGLGFCFLLVIFLASGPLALGAVFISCLITKIMVNVLGEPSYQLLFKVIPPQERDGVRFLMEALVVLGGMLGGAALSGLHSENIMAMPTVSIGALLLAAAAFYIAWKTRASYLQELIACIANGVEDLRKTGPRFLATLSRPGF